MAEARSSKTQKTISPLSFLRRDASESSIKRISIEGWAEFFHVDVRRKLTDALPKLGLDSSIQEILSQNRWILEEDELPTDVRDVMALRVYDHHGRHLFFTSNGDWVVVHYQGEEILTLSDNRRDSMLGVTHKFLDYEGFVEIFGPGIFFPNYVLECLANELNEEVQRLIRNQRHIDHLAFGFRSDVDANRTLRLH